MTDNILNPTGSKVTLPVPPDAGALTDLYTGLNTLDGFSTTAPIVTENGDAVGPLIGGRVDPASIVFGQAGNINLVAAGPGGAALPTTPHGTIKAHA